MERLINVAIVTVSDRASSGERENRSGPALVHLVEQRLGRVIEAIIVPDEWQMIRARLIELVDERRADLVLTTGGTGVSPRDVTPEATRDVIEREVPGVAELMRLEGLRRTPLAMISRAVCGIRGRSVILNLPGSPTGAVENLEAVLSLLPHLIDKVQGDPSDCGHPMTTISRHMRTAMGVSGGEGHLPLECRITNVECRIDEQEKRMGDGGCQGERSISP